MKSEAIIFKNNLNINSKKWSFISALLFLTLSIVIYFFDKTASIIVLFIMTLFSFFNYKVNNFYLNQANLLFNGLTDNNNILKSEKAKLKNELDKLTKLDNESKELLQKQEENITLFFDFFKKNNLKLNYSLQHCNHDFRTLRKSLKFLDTEEISNKNQFDNNFKNLNIQLQEVQNKIQVIDEIVLQTKLLSFNASVEAARAGKAGNGFSVVAGEIAKLAEVSSVSSTEINELVEKTLKSSNELQLMFLNYCANEVYDKKKKLFLSEIKAQITTHENNIHEEFNEIKKSIECYFKCYEKLESSLINSNKRITSIKNTKTAPSLDSTEDKSRKIISVNSFTKSKKSQFNDKIKKQNQDKEFIQIKSHLKNKIEKNQIIKGNLKYTDSKIDMLDSVPNRDNDLFEDL